MGVAATLPELSELTLHTTQHNTAQHSTAQHKDNTAQGQQISDGKKIDLIESKSPISIHCDTFYVVWSSSWCRLFL